MTDYKVELIPVSQIKPYENNNKTHTEKQIKQIAESIRQFGFRQNIVVDKGGVIVIGHGRFEAAKLLGYDSVPCVRVEDLTDEQIKALRIIDNKTNESEWDFDNLNLELESLDGLFDFEPFDLSIEFDDEAEQAERSPTSDGSHDDDFVDERDPFQAANKSGGNASNLSDVVNFTLQNRADGVLTFMKKHPKAKDVIDKYR